MDQSGTHRTPPASSENQARREFRRRRRRVAGRWFASNGVPYQVQWSTDQINWNNLGSQINGSGSSNIVYDTSGVIHNYQVLSIQRIVQAP